MRKIGFLLLLISFTNVYGESCFDVADCQVKAGQGNVDAQFSLGLMYALDEIHQDFKEAAKWYRRSAEQGNAGAQYNLGLMYINGHGVAKDYKEAVKWIRKSADQGITDALFNLGGMYAKGQGVPQDYVMAYMYWDVSATRNVEALPARDEVAKAMTLAQIEKAQTLSQTCLASKYKNCIYDSVTEITNTPSKSIH